MDSGRDSKSQSIEQLFYLAGPSCGGCAERIVDKIKAAVPSASLRFLTRDQIGIICPPQTIGLIRKEILPDQLFSITDRNEYLDWETRDLNRNWAKLGFLIFIGLWVTTLSWVGYLTPNLSSEPRTHLALVTLFLFSIFAWIAVDFIFPAVRYSIQFKKFTIEALLMIELLFVPLLATLGVWLKNYEYIFLDSLVMSQIIFLSAQLITRQSTFNEGKLSQKLPSTVQLNDSLQTSIPAYRLSLANFLIVIFGLIITTTNGNWTGLISLAITLPILICPCIFTAFLNFRPNLKWLFTAFSLAYSFTVVLIAIFFHLSPQTLALAMVCFITVNLATAILTAVFQPN